MTMAIKKWAINRWASTTHMRPSRVDSVEKDADDPRPIKDPAQTEWIQKVDREHSVAPIVLALVKIGAGEHKVTHANSAQATLAFTSHQR
jgi:hypothetical protein